MSYILAIEPDPRQAAALRSVAERLGAELTLADSNVSAIASINRRLPDLILLTALFSPREEDELVAHLRSLEGAEYLQTLTIPLLASGDDDGPKRGLFGFGKRKPEPETRRCDPGVFAEQVNGYLKTANELKATAEAAREYTTLRAAAEPAIEMAELAETAQEPIPADRLDYVPETPDFVPGEVAEAQPDVAPPVMEEPAVERAPRPPLISFSAERLGELLQRESGHGSPQITGHRSPQITTDSESSVTESYEGSVARSTESYEGSVAESYEGSVARSYEGSVTESYEPSVSESYERPVAESPVESLVESAMEGTDTESIEPWPVIQPPPALEPASAIEPSSEIEPAPATEQFPQIEPAVVFEPALEPIPNLEFAASSESPTVASPDIEPPPAFEPPLLQAPEPPIVVPPAPVRLVRRLPPLAMWARIQTLEPEKPRKEAPANGAFHVSELLESLRVPAFVLPISYPQGCRIQRVRTA